MKKIVLLGIVFVSVGDIFCAAAKHKTYTNGMLTVAVNNIDLQRMMYYRLVEQDNQLRIVGDSDLLLETMILPSDAAGKIKVYKEALLYLNEQQLDFLYLLHSVPNETDEFTSRTVGFIKPEGVLVESYINNIWCALDQYLNWDPSLKLNNIQSLYILVQESDFVKAQESLQGFRSLGLLDTHTLYLNQAELLKNPNAVFTDLNYLEQQLANIA